MIHHHTYENGLTLVAEPMPHLHSAAFVATLPAGSATDPLLLSGLSNFTCDMLQRGCGDRDSRQFLEALERLGVDSNASVAIIHSSYGGAMPAVYLNNALPLFADLLRRPRLPDDRLEEARMVCLQEFYSLEDEPAQNVLTKLRQHYYPDPWSRTVQGTEESLRAITGEDVRRHFRQYYRPNGTILSAAGRFEWEELRDRIGELFGDWPAVEQSAVEETPSRGRYFHYELDSNQTHIAVAYRSVPYGHDDYYFARGAVGVLSDGMSSRLFTEVREKRGLCYSVYAACYSLRHRGSVICYAGTSNNRAQETLDVTLGELNRLAEGIEQGELDRLKARIKSSLIMQQESSGARASSIAGDWYYLNRVQTIEEIGRIIDGLRCEDINRYLRENPPGDFTIVTLGPEPLEVEHAIS